MSPDHGGQTHRTYTQDELLRMAPSEFEALQATASGRNAIARSGGNPRHPHGEGCACSECFVENLERQARGPVRDNLEAEKAFETAGGVDALARANQKPESRAEIDQAFERLKVREVPERDRCVSKVEGAADILGVGVTFLKAALDHEQQRVEAGDGWPMTMDKAIEAIGEADNWKHRSQGMKCSTCMWHVPKRPASAGKTGDHPGDGIGRCRKHCPTMGGWPVMKFTDWCGDHKLDEEKV